MPKTIEQIMRGRKPIVSEDGSHILRHELIDDRTSIVVCDSDQGCEWGLIESNHVTAESGMLYGDASAALRDGLMFSECQKVLWDRTGDGDFELAKPTVWVYPRGQRPEFKPRAKAST